MCTTLFPIYILKMDTRTTRKRSAQIIKVEQESCSNLSQNDGDSLKTDCKKESAGLPCDECFSDDQANVTHTGDAGETDGVLDENNNLEPSTPDKGNAEFTQESNAPHSPTKQMKLAHDTLKMSVVDEADGEDKEQNECQEGENECQATEEEQAMPDEIQSPVDENNEDCDREASAEEIVQKLCKNGKVLTLTEGEKYFKVIVYEDSEENKETENVEHNGFNTDDSHQNLLQKIVDGDFDEDTQSEHSESQHILSDRTNILNNVPTGITQTVTASHVISAMPPTVAETAQWYSDVCSPAGYSHASPAAAIQSNFAQTMSQFAPAFLTTNVQDTQESIMPFSNSENTPQFMKPVGSQPTASQRLFCTPHPKNGQYMFYFADDESNQPRTNFIPFSTSTPLGRPKQQTSSKSKSRVAPNSITLNSSGEENTSPPEHLPNMNADEAERKSRSLQSRVRLDPDIELMGEEGTLREQHNQKERRRRARIKEACDLMRQLVPGMSDKTDKATVFEFGARYIHFLKSFIGTEHDKDFLMKYSPY